MKTDTRLVVGILVGLVVVGCFRPEPLSAATHTVIVGNFFFNPTNISVAQGDTIIWTNRSTSSHDTTQGSASTPTAQRLWISPNLPALTGNYRFTFTNTGIYPYICLQHIANRPQQTGTVTVVGGNFAPAVSMTSPAPGTRHPAPPNFLASANATDPDGSVTNVLFTATATSGGALTVLGSDDVAPFSVRVTDLPPANYQFRAIAYDDKGAFTTSSVVSVAITTPVPLVLSAPARNAQNQFHFDLATTLGLIYVVEESSEIDGTWKPVSTNTAPGASLRINRQFDGSSPTQRLYRAFIVP